MSPCSGTLCNPFDDSRHLEKAAVPTQHRCRAQGHRNTVCLCCKHDTWPIAGICCTRMCWTSSGGTGSLGLRSRVSSRASGTAAVGPTQASWSACKRCVSAVNSHAVVNAWRMHSPGCPCMEALRVTTVLLHSVMVSPRRRTRVGPTTAMRVASGGVGSYRRHTMSTGGENEQKVYLRCCVDQ